MRGCLRVLAVLLIMAPSPGLCSDEAPGLSNIMQDCSFWSFVGGRNFHLKPTPEEIESSPVWRPGDSEEPLVSPIRAMRAAEVEFNRSIEDPDHWGLSTIDLVNWCKGRWVWVVTWQPRDRGVTGVISVPVLMSGIVLPLTRLAEGKR